MKNLFLAIVLTVAGIVAVTNEVHAQCSPDSTITAIGFSLNNNYCFARGIYSEQVWQFVNYNMYSFSGNSVTVDSIIIDSIINLPCGVHWTTDKRVYSNSEHGCLTFWGVPDSTDDTLSYRLDFAITAYINGSPSPLNQHYSFLGDYVFVRVVQPGIVCTQPDTTSAADSTHGCETGRDSIFTSINDVQATVKGLNNYPNPFNSNTEIVYNTTTADHSQMTFRVYDLLGNTVHEETVAVAPGKNIISFDRKGISSGIYFYSISNGKQTYTNKMVIAD